MPLNEFTFSLIVLAFPGILVYMILRKVAPEREESGVEKFLKIFVYSISAYIIYALFLKALAALPFLGISASATFDWKSIETGDIIGATVAALLLTLLLTYALNYMWLNRLLSLLRASKRSGHKDAWTLFHNIPLSQRNSGFMLVRDHSNSLVYYGFIYGWSEKTEGNKELVLQNVAVYSDSGTNPTLLYETPWIYLNQKPECISIESPNPEKIHEYSNFE